MDKINIKIIFNSNTLEWNEKNFNYLYGIVKFVDKKLQAKYKNLLDSCVVDWSSLDDDKSDYNLVVQSNHMNVTETYRFAKNIKNLIHKAQKTLLT